MSRALRTLARSRERVVVIGGGIAGLATALHLAPIPVTLLLMGGLGAQAATAWAQGGIAAAFAPDDDPALHAADTLAASAGLGDPALAARVAAAAPAAVEDLIARGARFDRDGSGKLALGLEAAHSRRRILHAGGDATGHEVLRALMDAVRCASSIEILEGTSASDLALEDGVMTGVLAERADAWLHLPARAVVLATGGVGGLYGRTTNPLGALGSGLALAARAGGVLRDVEFVQFHPTAIALGRDPMPLATEALRGEGALLVNARGERFMADVPGCELAPRDVVARAIWRQIEAGEPVYLDARDTIGERFPERFPSVTALCRQAGLDPVKQPIPVAPAAHYHMGGVAADGRGRTSVAGLWGCGEVAATGLHGANRLASNSLLEALVFARWIAQDIAGLPPGRPARPIALPDRESANGRDPAWMAEVRRLMTASVGVIRDESILQAAVVELAAIAFAPRHPSRAADAALAGLFIAAAALERRESRGAHYRCDHPDPCPPWTRSIELTLASVQRQLTNLRAKRSVARGE